MFAPLDHEEDDTENLMVDGDDRSLMAAPNNQATETST